MGKYANDLSNRLRRRIATNIDPVASLLNQRIDRPQPKDVYEIVVPPHPMKYPKHKTSKGSVLGGICNITRCVNIDAHMFNLATRGYYCHGCALRINEVHRPDEYICAQADHNLTHAEMDQLYWSYFKLTQKSGVA